MKWWDRFIEWSWQKEAHRQFEEGQQQKQVIHMMADDVDPMKLR